MMTRSTYLVGLFAAFFMFLSILPAIADTEDASGIVTDEDALFGDPLETAPDAPFIEEVTSTAGIASSLLISEGVEIGGRYGLSVNSSWTWKASEFFDAFTSPESDSTLVDLNTTLFFDARPLKDFRVFGKTSISYPFDDQGGAREFDEVFRIDELFSDFTWRDLVFFRGGKHTINWGVGYFFSPADLLNITEIDPEDPEAEREGPISLKTHFPLDVHNFYLYLIANNIEAADEFGVAGKIELVISSIEIGIGALYQKDVSPSGMLTVSFPFWDIDFFGEAVLRYGSDRTFIEESDAVPLGVSAVTYDDELFFNATAGFSFIYAFDEIDSSISMFGQYLYNGEGYDDSSILKDNQISIGELVGNGDITIGDLMSPGRHYAAANVAWNGIFDSDFALQAFWMHNFSGMSGFINPALSVEVFNAVRLKVGLRYLYGEEGDEFSPTDDSLTAQISVGFGGGSF